MKIFFGTNESGVAYWRGKLPGNKINKLGLAEAKIFSVYGIRPDEADNIVKGCDVVYCPSPCGVEAVVEFLKYYRTNIATVGDYDDNLFDCHPFNPGYATLGLKEAIIRVPDDTKEGGYREEYLWQDQRKGFSLKDNIMRFNSHIDVLNISSMITTTTATLRDKLSEASGRAAEDFSIVPNSIDFDIFKPFSKRIKNHKKLRIGWTASDSHLLECTLVTNIFKKLFEKRNDFELVIIGNMQKFRSVANKFPIEWHNFVDVNIYPMKLASLELDIGLAPLEDFSFNHFKSELKWNEYAAYKIPTVASDVTPYKVIRHGIDGMVAKTADDFVQCLSALLDDSKLRNDIAEAAFQRTYEDYNLDINVHKWMEAFERALIRKDMILEYKGSVIPRIPESVAPGVLN